MDEAVTGRLKGVPVVWRVVRFTAVMVLPVVVLDNTHAVLAS